MIFCAETFYENASWHGFEDALILLVIMHFEKEYPHAHSLVDSFKKAEGV